MRHIGTFYTFSSTSTVDSMRFIVAATLNAALVLFATHSEQSSTSCRPLTLKSVPAKSIWKISFPSLITKTIHAQLLLLHFYHSPRACIFRATNSPRARHLLGLMWMYFIFPSTLTTLYALLCGWWGFCIDRCYRCYGWMLQNLEGWRRSGDKCAHTDKAHTTERITLNWIKHKKWNECADQSRKMENTTDTQKKKY